MTDIPTITFQCIGCDHSEEIELEKAILIESGSTMDAWIVPDPWEADWHRNEDGQLVCQTCHTDYPEPERSETLSASERNLSIIAPQH